MTRIWDFSISRRARAKASQPSLLGAAVAKYKPTFRVKWEGQPQAESFR